MFAPLGKVRFKFWSCIDIPTNTRSRIFARVRVYHSSEIAYRDENFKPRIIISSVIAYRLLPNLDSSDVSNHIFEITPEARWLMRVDVSYLFRPSRYFLSFAERGIFVEFPGAAPVIPRGAKCTYNWQRSSKHCRSDRFHEFRSVNWLVINIYCKLVSGFVAFGNGAFICVRATVDTYSQAFVHSNNNSEL